MILQGATWSEVSAPVRGDLGAGHGVGERPLDALAGRALTGRQAPPLRKDDSLGTLGPPTPESSPCRPASWPMGAWTLLRCYRSGS